MEIKTDVVIVGTGVGGAFSALNLPADVKGTEYLFCEQRYFDDAISIWLPEKFIELPDAIKKLKYPGEGKIGRAHV